MKIKIFQGCSITNNRHDNKPIISIQIEKWFAQNVNIKVINITQSTIGEEIVISIFYEDKES